MSVAWDSPNYHAFFRQVNGFGPYDYQIDVARRLAAGENVMLGAPTGAGKTLTVLMPFLYKGWVPRPARLIYALPLRTLAQSIYAEARRLVERVGLDPERVVTMQTGEQPDDPFFALGRIVVTTYDQVLSGLLGGPYGLSRRLHNMNSAALVGTLVVFDEFHLMEPQRAFLTGAAGLHLLRQLCQCVWMTATATTPLRDVLADAAGCVDASPSHAEVAALPTVVEVRREVVLRSEPLTPESVLQACDGRTIVICNTVARAQKMFQALRSALPDSVPCLLLHSRFFKGDRVDKEQELKRLLGKGRRERAVLIATQVIEAGIDISCDDLHTELCPMNALVQRAGRCARYPGETGTVHVYPLGDEAAQPWLPYGDRRAPDPTLTATEVLLRVEAMAGTALTPDVAAAWVEAVHREVDERTLRTGWQSRLAEMLRRITCNAIERQPVAVGDLIREESTDEVRVVVADAAELPERPTRREAVKLSRWALTRAFDAGGPGGAGPVVWGWSSDDEPHWEPLQTAGELARYYHVCVSPSVARYTRDVGLEVGVAGVQASPPRVEPRRPGHALQREGWADHALAVRRTALARVAEEDDSGWLSRAIEARYGLAAEELQAAAAACGLLHDLGKLQQGWQAWAEAWERTQDAGYAHEQALAHTTYDPDNRDDRARLSGFEPKRPPHAAQSACLATAVLGAPLATVARERQGLVGSACMAAILGHHGGWLPTDPRLGLAEQLWRGWEADLRRCALNGEVSRLVRQVLAQADRRRLVARLLDLTVAPERLNTYWPLVAFLTRTLRLADQRATAEAGSE